MRKTTLLASTVCYLWPNTSAARGWGIVDWSSSGPYVVLLVMAVVYLSALFRHPRNTILGTFAVVSSLTLVYGSSYLLYEEFGPLPGLGIGLVLAAGVFKIAGRFMRNDDS